MKRYSAAHLLTAMLIAAGFDASAAPPPQAHSWGTIGIFTNVNINYQDKVSTPIGTLAIVKKGDDGDETFSIALRGKIIAAVEDGPEFVSIEAIYPAKHPRYFLIELSSGGDACPDFYELVDLNNSAAPIVTGQFGNCNVLDNIQLVDGVLHFKIPSVQFEDQEDEWDYKDGKLTEHLAKSGTRRPDPE
jgi:hypothetical protein